MLIEDVDDEREIELSAIAAIFPELVVDRSNYESQNVLVARLHLPVRPLEPLNVVFESRSTSKSKLSSPPASVQEGVNGLVKKVTSLDYCQITNLPPLLLDATLPVEYPTERPPAFSLSCSPSWMPENTVEQLKSRINELWDEYGRGQVLFACIDLLQHEADSAFGLSNLQLPVEDMVAILAFDERGKAEVFNTQTFDCGICLEPKRGEICYRLRRCGHVFCKKCLQDFYNSAITEGDISQVRCIEVSCVKNSRRRGKHTRSIHPKELLQIPLEESIVQRYVDLKIKKRLEADTSTIYCPREWCQGPARTKKHHLRNDIHSFPESESEDEHGLPPESRKTAPDVVAPDRLNICSTCGYAFCRVCLKSWHGDLFNCQPRNPAELTEEDRASYDYIRLHTSPCPTCSTPVQKSMGCNHMHCVRCNSHFCYLCSSWLSAQDPYKHFNTPGTPCFEQLWVLEEGDEVREEDAGPRGDAAHFYGARAYEAAFLQEAGVQYNNAEVHVQVNAVNAFDARNEGNVVPALQQVFVPEIPLAAPRPVADPRPQIP